MKELRGKVAVITDTTIRGLGLDLDTLGGGPAIAHRGAEYRRSMSKLASSIRRSSSAVNRARVSLGVSFAVAMIIQRPPSIPQFSVNGYAGRRFDLTQNLTISSMPVSIAMPLLDL